MLGEEWKMEAPGGRWALLLLVTGAWAQNVSVSVVCGSSRLQVTVLADLFGNGVPISARELMLGAGCAVTAVQPDRFQLDYLLSACGATMELLPDTIHYRNFLYYRPSAVGGVIRASAFSVPIDCFYSRTGNVSSLGLQPTWAPFSSTLMHRQRLDFALDVYDSTWSSPLSDPTYYLGDLINIQASVRTGSHAPLKIYVDECVARPSMESSMKYEVITDHGCLVDGQHSRSRFLALRGDQFLRFQLDTFVFTNASNNQIYLLCHLKAVAAGPANQRNKACSYDPVAAVWRSQEGGDCSCCASPAGCESRKRRRHQPPDGRGLLGEADLQLGPIRLASNLSTTLVSSPLTLASAELTSAMAGAVELSSTGPFSGTPKASRPVLFPPNRAANPIIRGEAKDSSGLRLPFSVTTLAIAVLCSLFVFLGILGCYCSTKRYHRGYRMGAADTATGETSAVAMAPTASGDVNVASKKPGAVVAAACGESGSV
ncbi:zona pellucida sperm-binding protein 3-like [Emydura macquarii macquarii]|uniref:zona pellucida sperm-binding protein 3-like n=1 Tax=Emydura macquarii macquarii TaxID=1129001 RepID=UPI00352B2DBC